MNRARKRFGQHFLEPAWVDKVVHAIAPAPDQVFLEIGPGRGALTRPLAARAKWLVTSEIDRDLAAGLREASLANVTVLEGDFLKLPAALLSHELAAVAGAGESVRVAGNLPYNVASPILFRLLELFGEGVAFADASLMLQREVADRLIASPGTRDYGVLSVLVGYSADVQRILALPPGAFRPAPEVRSALVRLRFRAPAPAARNPAIFGGLVQAIFTRRRKTLANALGAFHLSAVSPPDRVLPEAGIDGRRRPETLSIPELVRLADVFAGRSSPAASAGFE